MARRTWYELGHPAPNSSLGAHMATCFLLFLVVFFFNIMNNSESLARTLSLKDLFMLYFVSNVVCTSLSVGSGWKFP